MKKTEYLYNCPASIFKGLPYEEALKLKIELIKKLRPELIKEAREVEFLSAVSKYKYKRLADIDKARTFNLKLLDELYE